MAKSTRSRTSGKPAKPARPYAGFPLFPHASGTIGLVLDADDNLYLANWDFRRPHPSAPGKHAARRILESLAWLSQRTRSYTERRVQPDREAPAGFAVTSPGTRSGPEVSTRRIAALELPVPP